MRIFKNDLVLKLLILGLFVAVCAVFVYAWYVYTNYNETPDTQRPYVSEEEKKAVVEDMLQMYEAEKPPAVAEGVDPLNYGLEEENDDPLEGYLIFSGKKIRIPNEVKIYALDLSSSTSEPFVYLPQYPTSAMAEFEDPSDPDSLYFITSPETTGLPESDNVGVALLTTNPDSIISYVSTRGQNERRMAWSSTAKLLALNRMNSNASNYVDLLPLKNWEVAIVDPLTDTTIDVIKEAHQPQWSPDGTKLLYLKKDGLYTYNLEQKLETKVVPVADGGEIIAMSMIDLSPDGSHLIWTTAKAGVMSMSEITSWEPFEITEIGRIHEPETEYYWPRFSPDGEHYTVQAIDSLKEGDEVRQNPRFEVRPTLGRVVKFTYPIDQFSYNLFFTDDWITPQE